MNQPKKWLEPPLDSKSKWRIVEAYETPYGNRKVPIDIVPNLGFGESRPDLFRVCASNKGSNKHADFYVEDLQGEGLARIIRIKNRFERVLAKFLEERKQVYLTSKYAEYDAVVCLWQAPPPANSENLSLCELLERVASATIIRKDYLDDRWYSPSSVEELWRINHCKNNLIKVGMSNFVQVEDEEFRNKILSFEERLLELRGRWKVVYRWILAAVEYAASNAALKIATENSIHFDGIVNIHFAGDVYLFEWKKHVYDRKVTDSSDLSLSYKGFRSKYEYSIANVEIG